jgi:hypothetical protein
MRLLFVVVLLVLFLGVRTSAQDDPAEVPLGDVARNLRKKTPPQKPVIDDDNLPQAMQEAEKHDHSGSALRFLMSGTSKGFEVSAPDVTCSLSFSANVKSLLSAQYDQMDLPPAELAKIQGKAVVEGDALTVPVFNATQWHLSELAVAFTVVRKPRSGIGPMDAPLLDPDADAFQQVRPEKKPDLTMIYRMRAAALPWSNAVFSAPLTMELAPGEEWHWAIVQAKGYPPETYVSAATPSLTQPASHESLPSTVSMKNVEPETPGQAQSGPQ